MTVGAIVFMVVSWILVLGLMTWSFGRILTHTEKPRPGRESS